ncbi:MAG: hypothetical protein PHW62_00430 [Candidatus Ratteibacteria bacterium]|nr:hypothetical protein [Candidatus Ratteibacteria bacterium]
MRININDVVIESQDNGMSIGKICTGMEVEDTMDMKKSGEPDKCIVEEKDEFNINNFPDLSEHGTKKQCIECHQWDYFKNLTSEDGVNFYHPGCETTESYKIY